MDGSVIIHVGYFKTGTTWFQKVFFPKVKNVVFSNQANASLDNNLVLVRPFDFSPSHVTNYVDNLFENDNYKTLILSRERLSGHPFTGGYDAKVIANRLKETYPSAVVVFFIREQVNAIISTYKEYVKRGGIAPFKKWIFTQERTIPSFDLDYFKYDKQIKYYIKLFGKDNIKVYAYEDFKNTPEAFLKEFCKDLKIEVELSQFNFNKQVNKGFSTQTLKLVRWSNKFSISKNLNPYPPIKIPFLRFLILKLCNVLDSFFYKEMNYSLFDSKTETTIKELYRESNCTLSSLLDLDLESKGYYLGKTQR